MCQATGVWSGTAPTCISESDYRESYEARIIIIPPYQLITPCSEMVTAKLGLSTQMRRVRQHSVAQHAHAVLRLWMTTEPSLFPL